MGERAQNTSAPNPGITPLSSNSHPHQLATSLGATNTIMQLRVTANNFSGLLNEQESLQKDVKKNPGNYAGKYVTVGFEHEFAGMEDELFHGVSHLQIAQSEEKLPYNNLPFFLETDAGNELEMVDPPLLIETVAEGKPIPHPVDVDIAARIIEGRLYDIVNQFPTVYELAAMLGSDPGIHFHIPRIQIEPKHLSHNTQGNFTEGKNQIAPHDVGQIRLRPSEKHSKIATQINFATDAQTYFKMQEFNETKPEPGLLSIAEDMATHITQSIQVESEAQGMFVTFLHRVLSEQMAIPFMEQVRKMQQEEYEGGTKIRDSEHRDSFRKGAGLSSTIKDKNRVWIKDSLMSIGAGIMTEKDWEQLTPDLYNAKETAEKMTIDNTNEETERYFNLAKTNMVAALEELIEQIGEEMTTPKTIYTPNKGTEFLEHNPKLLGARQDTYISPGKAQMPGVWDNKRLHVVETRGRGLQALVALANDNPEKNQIVKDEANDKNYNVLRHGHFYNQTDSPTGKSGFHDPVFNTFEEIGGNLYSNKDHKTPIEHTDRMHYNPKIKMYYDPKMAMYYDAQKKAYYDQGLQMYYNGKNKAYYNDDVTITLDDKENSETKGMYINEEKEVYYDPVKRAWYNAKTKKYTDVRTKVFTNPSENITYDPKSEKKKELKPGPLVPLRTIYPNYDEAIQKETTGARILAQLGDVKIPDNTPPSQMSFVAMIMKNK